MPPPVQFLIQPPLPPDIWPGHPTGRSGEIAFLSVAKLLLRRVLMQQSTGDEKRHLKVVVIESSRCTLIFAA